MNCMHVSNKIEKKYCRLYILKLSMINSSTLPSVARLAIRTGEYFKMPTSGVCQGYFQTNLTILPSKYANDFQKFCKANEGAFPLLFQSKRGQCDAPLISKNDSDIRTDVSAYCVWKYGERTEVVGDLLKYSDVFEDFTTSYLGCSFSFDQQLLRAGIPLRNIEQKCNVSMYITNIRCYPVGPFTCNLVVSLRPIPKQLVGTAFKITSPLSKAHGAPVHIGDPALIGIRNIAEPDYGNALTFMDEDVPVFWACGVTGVEAIKALKPPLAFSHFPGSMYICDTPLDDDGDGSLNGNTEDPCVIDVSDEPYFASVASNSTVMKIAQLEKLIMIDPGMRGIEGIVVKDDLLKSALLLSHASSVAIITGFPCMIHSPCLFENDGLSGAVALAVMLQSLGKQVCFLADENTLDVIMESFIETLLAKGILTNSIPVVSYPFEMDGLKASQFLTEKDRLTPRFDHLVAIERSGVANDGNYYTAKGRDISKHIANMDLIFQATHLMPNIKTTAIGDGGNELGMGKVLEKVHKHIPMGEKIACVTATDCLITAGVSNWGGYALSAALALLYLCPIHDRYIRRSSGFSRPRCDIVKNLPTVDKERKVLEILLEMGMYDGILDKKSLSVDGLAFEGVHSKIIQDIGDVCL